MTDPQHDPQMLDDILGNYRNRWYARGCVIGRIIGDLDDGPFRSKLIGYLSLPTRDLGHAPICQALEETLGEKIRADTMGRHRSRKCACPDEVWS